MKAQEFGYSKTNPRAVIPYTLEQTGIKGRLTYWRRQGMKLLEPGDKLILTCVYPGAAGEVLKSDYRDKKGDIKPEDAKDGHGTIEFILYDSLNARLLIEQQTEES